MTANRGPMSTYIFAAGTNRVLQQDPMDGVIPHSVTIGANVAAADGTAVRKSVPSRVVVAGNPALIVSQL